MAFSIVIVCRNEEEHIGNCLAAVHGLTDDIVVVDTGSTDGTLDIVRSHPVRLIQKEWMGYGATKNFANSETVHDWVLSIDADEIVDEALFQSLTKWIPVTDPVFSVKRINHIGQRAIKHGHLKAEIKLRLFNKTKYSWDDQPVHELLTPKVSKRNTQLLEGRLLHYQAASIDDLKRKYELYAKLTEPKKKLIRSIVPYYHFVKSYVFQLGFIQGTLGLQLSREAYRYSYQKLYGPK